MGVTARIEGLDELVRNLGELPKATRRNVLRRVLLRRAEPIANQAAQIAPESSGKLAFSIAASTQLTRRQRRGAKVNEVEVYIGPAGGTGALNYASFVEFGTIDTPAQPYMRSAWESGKERVLIQIGQDLGQEIEAAAGRLSRKAARAGG
jgi:HK97 gp10 family phage protein